MSDLTFKITLPSNIPSGFALLSHNYNATPCVTEEELDLLAPNCSDKRREQFVLGRTAARQSLSQIGCKDHPSILRTNERCPVWRSDIVGSITHCNEYAAAMVGYKKDYKYIGIDLEKIRPAKHLMSRIASPAEQEWISQGGEEESNTRFIMLFSAKESIYKAFYPICNKYFGFFDVELTISQDNLCFNGRLLVDLSRELKNGMTFVVDSYKASDYVLTLLKEEV